MKLTTDSEVPVYTISGEDTARPLPDWLSRKRKRQLRQDSEEGIELLQDFGFEEASQCLRISEDGEWLMSTGTYKPQIHTHYLQHLSLSYERHTDATNRRFVLLSPDARKSLHLQSDRSLNFHTAGGLHYATRIPRYGRDLKYDTRTAEALITSVGPNADGMGEVFRFNLEQGRFMKSLELDIGSQSTTSVDPVGLQGAIDAGSIDTMALAERSHGLQAYGTSLGTTEFWDPRSRTRAAILPLPKGASYSAYDKVGISCLEFDRSGLALATGTTNGLVYLYDLRSPQPLLKKDQGNGWAIQKLIFLESSTESVRTTEDKVLSADKTIIKLWDRKDGTPWTHASSSVDINDVAWYPDSGMILTANEGPRQNIFFVPTLGPAPRWCTFLDSLVEDYADGSGAVTGGSSNQPAGQVYDNYKFVTLEELRTLQMAHLVGKTSLLRPYMHGYFVAQRLYDEARLITQPTIWEEQRTKMIRAKIEKDRESRIRGHKKALTAVKVNKRLAEKAATNDKKSAKLLGDDRFSKLFQDEEFAIDENSREFFAINPSAKVKFMATKAVAEEREEKQKKEEEARKPAVGKGGKMRAAVPIRHRSDGGGLDTSANEAPRQNMRRRKAPRG
ncbi:Small ribosomal subunit biogenesis [Ceratocystis pirilliformis]|uniref:Small ribosomal subunit biogenesis n=1 Tax=Ceratocystis pirilliformis TaxID=259994 RepID=A0ABR3YIL9_9PEZI